MTTQYLGRVPFEVALAEEDLVFKRVLSHREQGRLIGFEAEPVVTLGARACQADLVLSQEDLRARGFSCLRVARGGQATLHNPGQLVIFPIFRFAPLGARAWVSVLAEVTKDFLADQGTTVEWDPCRPGLYSEFGKVVSFGLRLRQGVSSHGLAVNVHNDLSAFASIRACGQEGAPMDRLKTSLSLSELFDLWALNFKRVLTRVRNSPNLGGSSLTCARSSVG